MNWDLPDVQGGFRKGRGIRYQIASIRWIIEKAREFQKNIHFCFIDYAKAFDCVDHNKLWNVLKEIGISDHLTCFLRKPYPSQKATIRTLGGMTGSKLGKGYDKAVYCHPVYLTLCNPVDYSSPQGSSIHGILQTRILEWVAISFSRGFSWPRDWTQVSRIAGRCFNLWATREAQTYTQSISSEVPVLVNHEPESRLLGETLTISDIQMELKNLFSEEKLKNLLMRVKEVNE